MTPRVHAVIPAFNEADSIASVVEGVRAFAAAITVVDDGSSDGTAALALAAGAHVITLPVNSGKGMAIRAGIDHALSTDCTHVLFLDGDGQHLPDEAVRLIETAMAHGIPLAETLAVGDGANDVPMLREAGLGIAWRAKPAAAAAADARIEANDLGAILFAQGYRMAEWVAD